MYSAEAPTSYIIIVPGDIVNGRIGRRKVKDEEKQKPSESHWFIDTWMFEFSSVLGSYPKM